MKICKCGETNLEKFYKDKYKKDGLCFLCIKCMKEKQKTYKPSKEAVERKRIRQNSKTGYSWREKWRKSEKGLAWLKKRRLSNCITAGMHRSLKTNKNGFHWEDLVDYTLEDWSKFNTTIANSLFSNLHQWFIRFTKFSK